MTPLRRAALLCAFLFLMPTGEARANCLDVFEDPVAPTCGALTDDSPEASREACADALDADALEALQALYQRADEAFCEHNYPLVTEHLSQALEHHPQPSLTYITAQIYALAGDIGAARALFERALDDDALPAEQRRKATLALEHISALETRSGTHDVDARSGRVTVFASRGEDWTQAAVYLNGRKVAATPTDFDALSPGSYTLRVVLEDGRDETRRFRLQASQHLVFNFRFDDEPPREDEEPK